MDYQHKEKNVPQWINALHVISSWLPDINSISGLLFYTFVLYVIRICIKFYCAKPFDYYEEDKETVRDNKELLKRIEENRKIKAKEAEKLLNKIT
jgi:hypothetical protein